jgi:large subunit ribosomal protein L25
VSEVRITAEPRTELGKGAARRTRRAGRVPAVLYGHGTDPRHISLPGHDLMLALKTPNVLLRVGGLGSREELALPKEVQRDPIKGFLRHVDLIVVTRGEKVTVEIPVQVIGDLAPGGMLDQQIVQIAIEAEATHIPQSVEVSITGLEIGGSIYAKDLMLPEGSSLVIDEEALILHVISEPTAADLEGEATEGEAAEVGAEGETSGESAEQSGE